MAKSRAHLSLVPVDAVAPRLPTYRTVAGILEREKGSGWALAGWTVLRMALIAPPMVFVGVPWKQAIQGAALSSMLISTLTLLRIFDAKHTKPIAGLNARCRSNAARCPSSRRTR